MTSRKRKNPNDADISALHKEWDDISCPICMDHPHNAVRILCSAHEKGCTSFICDTSYRHSNCLDRFKKLITSDTNDTTATTPSLVPVNDNSTDANAIGYVELAGEPGDASNNISSSPSKSSLKCPLCRGSVSGYEVVEEARQYLNLKHRSCSQESCTFSGTYRELRCHARRAHPTARPSDVDPTRERAWRRLEHQREYGDIVSAIRSAMPGAVMFGDYAIDNPENRERGLGEGSNNGHWLTALFFFQMISSMDSPSADRRSGARARVPTRGRPRRLYWGETLLGLQDDEGNNDSDEDEDPFRLNVVNDNDEGRHPENPRRRRRRLTRYRSDEDQS
ncbi:putative transcription factor C2H2 family protein [Tanacetum coccineum]